MLNIAHTRLLPRIDEMPQNKPPLVHCRSGERSTYANAMLASHGFEAIQMDGGLITREAAGGEVDGHQLFSRATRITGVF